MTEKKQKSHASLRNLAAGDVLFREGEVGDFAFQIISGKIEICKFNGDEYVTLTILEKGALFGEMALIDESKRIASAVAVIDTVLIPVPKVAIQSILANADPLLRKLVSVLVSNARSLSDHIARVVEDEK